MAVAHMICGPTGAGKTTYARKLAEAEGAIRFSIDEWMAGLFEADAPEPLEFEWAVERVRRCENQIWRVCSEILARGGDVILDLGFTTRDQRDDHRARAAAARAEVRLHHVTADTELRRQRVQARNSDHSEIFAFEVTEGMFDFMENRFEAPGSDEHAVAVTSDGDPK